MCGIAGWIEWDRDLKKEPLILEGMAASLRHRGPDAQGVWASKSAALVHRRLIVIDPETGLQPMEFKSGDHSQVITFNGELYNFQELRTALRKRGHVFKTQSDTEVLLHSYVEWGEDCVSHLNGIFAFGVWDEARERLFLARDHLGVKPLFYARRGTTLVFGSEIKALFAHPQIKPRIGYEGLAQVFSALPVHVPGRTIYEGIFELPPAHTLVVERNGASLKRYWKLQSAPHVDDAETTAARILELLEDTVKRQLIADVPVSTMLSGGLDSSGITALAAREFKRQARSLGSYSIEFVDHAKYFKPNQFHLSLDTPWAEKVAAHAGTRHHKVVVDTADLIENLMVSTIARDAPGRGQMETSLYLLCKAMKRDATVALSGESADEVFGGYSWFFDPDAIAAPTFPWLPMLINARLDLMNFVSAEMKAKANLQTYIDQYYAEAISEVPRLEGESPEEARRRELLYLNQTRFLPILLDRKDRMSMAVGFEVRVPFCDHRLVQYVWNVPWAMKTVGDIEKGILRRALERFLPRDVLLRRKNPYPATHNPAYYASLCERALQIVSDPSSSVQPYIDAAALRRGIQQLNADSTDFPFTASIERLVQIEGWFKAYRVEVG